MGEEEFWALTLKELGALIKRQKTEHDWLNYRAALICSVLANIWRGKNTNAFKPDDFMPKEKVDRQTAEQILSNVQLWNAAFGGLVVEN